MKRDARQILTELLVLKAQGGEESAFREVYELWQGDVLRMAIARIGDRQTGREIAQDAWIAIGRGLPQLQDPACFPRWALQIVQRRSADWVRRRQRERVQQEEIGRRSGETMVASAEGFVRNEEAVLAEALRELSQEDRTLLGLFYKTGRSVAEIAEILAVPVGTIKSRLHAVRERLKTQIEKDTS